MQGEGYRELEKVERTAKPSFLTLLMDKQVNDQLQLEPLVDLSRSMPATFLSSTKEYSSALPFELTSQLWIE